jgi:hypothetical protein
MLCIRQRDLPGADGVVRGAFDGVFLIRRRVWLRPEVVRVAWCSTELQRDEVVFFEGSG